MELWSYLQDKWSWNKTIIVSINLMLKTECLSYFYIIEKFLVLSNWMNEVAGNLFLSKMKIQVSKMTNKNTSLKPWTEALWVKLGWQNCSETVEGCAGK